MLPLFQAYPIVQPPGPMDIALAIDLSHQIHRVTGLTISDMAKEVIPRREDAHGASRVSPAANGDGLVPHNAHGANRVSPATYRDGHAARDTHGANRVPPGYARQ